MKWKPWIIHCHMYIPDTLTLYIWYMTNIRALWLHIRRLRGRDSTVIISASIYVIMHIHSYGLLSYTYMYSWHWRRGVNLIWSSTPDIGGVVYNLIWSSTPDIGGVVYNLIWSSTPDIGVWCKPYMIIYSWHWCVVYNLIWSSTPDIGGVVYNLIWLSTPDIGGVVYSLIWSSTPDIGGVVYTT